MAHDFVDAGRVPVTLVRSVCSCGCRGQRLRIVTGDGRELSFNIGAVGKVNPETLRKFQKGVSIGQELLAFWERIKSVAL